ncbi:MAG: 3-phosphoshikimate 1-carboxyvinyltransferase [Pyrinomonadaceae bacterium]|nr:3-phosphoshikimate 1-carboxyvinyltransferase [Pyrinomonadaceae bacterium]
MMLVKTADAMNGEIDLPGDKSISHRAAILASLASGQSEIINYASGADCVSTLESLKRLGVPVRQEGTTVFLHGVGKRGLHKPLEPIDCGNSGTTIRLLAGVLAGQQFDSVLTGDGSLRKRPMTRIIEPLKSMGAAIDGRRRTAPLCIFGERDLKAVSYDLPVASAQVKSCILLAGLNAAGTTKIHEPETVSAVSPSRDHTERMLEYLGADIEEYFVATGSGYRHEVAIDGSSELTGKRIIVPSDISSASFFIVAAVCLKNSRVVIRNVGLNPTRTALVSVLQGFGADIEIRNKKTRNHELIGDLIVCGDRALETGQKKAEIERHLIPNIIDEIPILSVLGTRLPNGLEIRNAEELRVKESDRISSIVENLRKMGAAVEEFPDGFRVGRSELKGADVESSGDHRIAMAFAIAGLLATGETVIRDSSCADISFPGFFDILRKVVN